MIMPHHVLHNSSCLSPLLIPPDEVIYEVDPAQVPTPLPPLTLLSGPLQVPARVWRL